MIKKITILAFAHIRALDPRVETLAVLLFAVRLLAIAALFDPEHGPLLVLRFLVLFGKRLQQIAHHLDFRGKSVGVFLKNLAFHLADLVLVALLVAAVSGAFALRAAEHSFLEADTVQLQTLGLLALAAQLLRLILLILIAEVRGAVLVFRLHILLQLREPLLVWLGRLPANNHLILGRVSVFGLDRLFLVVLQRLRAEFIEGVNSLLILQAGYPVQAKILVVDAAEALDLPGDSLLFLLERGLVICDLQEKTIHFVLIHIGKVLNWVLAPFLYFLFIVVIVILKLLDFLLFAAGYWFNGYSSDSLNYEFRGIRGLSSVWQNYLKLL